MANSVAGLDNTEFYTRKSRVWRLRTEAFKGKAVNCPWFTALLQRDSGCVQSASLRRGRGMLAELLQACLNKYRILASQRHRVRGRPSRLPRCRSPSSRAAGSLLAPSRQGSTKSSCRSLPSPGFLFSSFFFSHLLCHRTLFLSHLFRKRKPR